jgi:hypothetical protein
LITLDRLAQARQLMRASHTIGLSPVVEGYLMVVTA